MVEPYRRRSALAHFGLAARVAVSQAQGADVILGEDPHRALVNIRGEIDDQAFRAACARILGAEPPKSPNDVADAGRGRIMWLGPNEWLMVAPDGESLNLVQGLRREFGDLHASAVDVSESRTTITISGPKARDFLSRAVSLDLHPRVFKPGQCAQTGFSRCNVLMHLKDDTPNFDIYVLKSFADYLWRWMELAGQDFRIAIAG